MSNTTTQELFNELNSYRERDERKHAKQSGRKVASDETMVRLPLNREIYNQAKAAAALKDVPVKQYVNEALTLMMERDIENGSVKFIAG